MESSEPAAAYRQRLEALRQGQAEAQRRLAWSGNARFIAFAVGFLQLWITAYMNLAWLPMLAAPLAIFIVFSIIFERARSQERRILHAMAWYNLGLARLEDRWMGQGLSGNEYLDPEHPCAADLDLFGSASMFERLCDAHTRVGRDVLARWLKEPSAVAAIQQRQHAVAELKPLLDWRQRFVLASARAPEAIDTNKLAAWAKVALTTPSTWPLYALPVVVLAMLGTLVAWSFGWWSVRPFLVALALQLGFAWWLRPRVQVALKDLHGQSWPLLGLTGLLRCVEGANFQAQRLKELQAAFQTEGMPPSQRLSELAGYIDQLDSTKNTFFAVLGPIVMWTSRLALRVESWRFHVAASLPGWMDAVGEMEALVCLAGYAYENPGDPFPEVVPQDGDPLLVGKALGHPLLPRGACIANDIELGQPRRLLLVSGSNMSGKSTYLRTIGLNVVLALAGAPVRAQSMRLTPFVVGATLRVQDSLQKGESRFYAEIRRLRQVVDLASGPMPLLFLLDEILHGTNSHDRRIGTEGIIHTLLTKRALGLVTTHDLALTEIAARLEPQAHNVHFADQLVDGRMHFDYQLHEGVVRHSNALALMRAVGLEVAGD